MNRAADVVSLPAREDPPKPPGVERDPAASAEWDRIVQLGGMTPRDAVMLAVYCTRYALTVRLWGELAKLPELCVGTERGGLKPHPVLSQANESERLLAMHASRLGLTPVDRGRVKEPAKPKRESTISKYTK